MTARIAAPARGGAEGIFRCRIFILKDSLDSTEIYPSAIAEDGFGDGFAVQKGAVGGTEVLDLKGAAEVMDDGMRARYGDVVEDDVVVGTAPDGDLLVSVKGELDGFLIGDVNSDGGNSEVGFTTD